MNGTEKRRRRGRMAAWAVWGLLLLPLAIGALGAHPATDDYTFAGIPHATWTQTGSLPHVVKDALSYTLRTYRDWQGTMSGVLAMCLNPAVFSFQGYGVHAVVLLLFWLGAFYVFLRAVLTDQMGFSRAFMHRAYQLLTLCQWLFVPSLIEGLYWHNGAWFYTGTTALFFLTVALLLRGGTGARRAALGMCVWIGLNNYVTAALACAVFTLLAVSVLPARGEGRRAGRKRWGVPLAAVLLPLLVSVLAPGNRVRMETDAMYGAESWWLVKSLVWTARDAAGYFGRFLFRTPLGAMLAFSFPWMLRAAKGCSLRARLPGVATLGAFVLLCAMIFPHMFTSGYAGPGRIVDLYHHYVVTALSLLTLYWAIWLAQRGGTVRGRWCAFAGTAALTVTLALSGGQAGEYVRLNREIFTGTLKAYREQTLEAYALLESAGPEDTVVVPGERITSVTGMQTGGPDAQHWQNVAMATYFNVAAVIRR
jgi:hypothetical protein